MEKSSLTEVSKDSLMYSQSENAFIGFTIKCEIVYVALTILVGCCDELETILCLL